MLFAPNGHFKFNLSLGGAPDASAQGEQTSLMGNAAVTLGEDPPINTEGTPGVAGKSTAPASPRAYHPLQHYNLGPQISANSENVDQPQREYDVIQAKNDSSRIQ